LAGGVRDDPLAVEVAFVPDEKEKDVAVRVLVQALDPGVDAGEAALVADRRDNRRRVRAAEQSGVIPLSRSCPAVSQI
jgi:hypothetical protein